MSTEYRKLYRSRSARMLGGVCGGLGEYFGIDPTLIRLAFILGVLLGFGSMLFVYLVMLIIVPDEPMTGTPPTQGS